MSLDLVFKNARLASAPATLWDVGIKGDRIAAIDRAILCDAPSEDLAGRLLFSGFVDSHIHLDKSGISSRCSCQTGTLQEAIRETAQAKRAFTEEDIYARGALTLEKAITQGTTQMRTHVELDPRIGLKGFHAIKRLKREYAWAIDLQICVFPQEGLTNDPGTEELLIEACKTGADLIGGCPYTDTEPQRHIACIFDLAQAFDLDIDFHLDFDLDPSHMALDDVCRETAARHYGGRVAVGHVTKLSAVSPAALDAIGRRLSDIGVAVTVLPATDLFLMGREQTYSVPRGVAPAHRLKAQGVTCSLATNNVLNPFTPFGDCSLLRMAHLYANILQLGRPVDGEDCFAMVTSDSARLMKIKDYGIAVGHPADLVVLDNQSAAGAVAELSPILSGYKNGRKSFTRPFVQLHRP